VTPRPRTVEVLDPVDRWLHLGAIAGMAGALATGPALETPALAEMLGPLDPSLVHGASAAVLVVVAALHGVRVCLWWLEGRNPWGLLPRPTDLVSLLRALAPFGPPERRGRYSHQERLAYLGFAVVVPALLVTGWVEAHPTWAVRWIGPAGLMTAARTHAALGLAALIPLGWHLFFALLAPEKLPWNPAWITGRAPLTLAERSWPAWVEEAEAPEAVAEAAPPSVEDLLEAGNAAARARDWDTAAAAYREALSLYPGYSQALFNLGLVCRRAGRHEECRRALERFLEQDPFSPVAPRAREILARLEEDRG